MPDTTYVPGPGRRAVGAAAARSGRPRPDRLAEAVAWAEQHETQYAINLQDALDELTQGEGEYATIVGPTKPRGGPAGLIVRHGLHRCRVG